MHCLQLRANSPQKEDTEMIKSIIKEEIEPQNALKYKEEENNTKEEE